MKGLKVAKTLTTITFVISAHNLEASTSNVYLEEKPRRHPSFLMFMSITVALLGVWL